MLEEKAKEIGRMIGQSTEYQAFRRAREALNADREAMTVMRELQTLQSRAYEMLERGEQPPPEMEEQLQALAGGAETRPVFQAMSVAQANLDKLMTRVNEWISQGIESGAQSRIITLG